MNNSSGIIDSSKNNNSGQDQLALDLDAVSGGPNKDTGVYDYYSMFSFLQEKPPTKETDGNSSTGEPVYLICCSTT